MDPIRNPFAPGAGTPPPELAGRDEVLDTARITLERSRLGRPVKSMVLVGLRGVGKTVLLDTIRERAKCSGMYTLEVEAAENRSLPSLLAPSLHVALLKLSRREAAKAWAHRALNGLAGFAHALKVTHHDIEVGLDFEPERGLADSGNLEVDLQALFEVAGEAAKNSSTALVLLVDELQQATAALDESFFLVRFDRLTQSEKRYLRAMAQLGTHTQQTDRQGHDLESRPWGHRLHGSNVRWIHATHHVR